MQTTNISNLLYCLTTSTVLVYALEQVVKDKLKDLPDLSPTYGGARLQSMDNYVYEDLL